MQYMNIYDNVFKETGVSWACVNRGLEFMEKRSPIPYLPPANMLIWPFSPERRALHASTLSNWEARWICAAGSRERNLCVVRCGLTRISRRIKASPGIGS